MNNSFEEYIEDGWSLTVRKNYNYSNLKESGYWNFSFFSCFLQRSKIFVTKQFLNIFIIYICYYMNIIWRIRQSFSDEWSLSVKKNYRKKSGSESSEFLILSCFLQTNRIFVATTFTYIHNVHTLHEYHLNNILSSHYHLGDREIVTSAVKKNYNYSIIITILL